MKVMIENILSAVSADKQNSNFPDDNMLDIYPSRLWMGTDHTAEITFTTSADTSNAFALFNTNALYASFSVEDPNRVALESGVELEAGVELAFFEITLTQTSSLDGVNGSCMIQWESITSVLSIVVTLTCDSDEIIYAGVAMAGELLSYPGPQYGFTESGVDFSLVRELSNGSITVKDRDRVRRFNLSARLTEAQANTFIGTVFKTLGSNAACWVVTDDDSSLSSRWLVYAMFSQMPRLTWEAKDIANMNCELTEVV